jgi:ubiquinone/menaquinone biosynthesis C-methylase UbiE
MDEISRKLNSEGRQLWDQKADFWDALHGEHGNTFHRQLVEPAVLSLLDLKKGENVMDVACGSGVMARRFAELGARVTALDFSAALIERAQERGQKSGSPIDYAVVDVTDEETLLSFGESQYDAIVCTMAFMDIPDITPLFRATKRLLKQSGRFVFATAHPAFNSSNPIFIKEVKDSHGELQINHFLRLKAYLDKPPSKGVGAPNEPFPHTYYHRSLHVLLGEAFTAKFVLDALEEPAFKPCDAKDENGLSWSNLWQFPPVLAGRFRPQP